MDLQCQVSVEENRIVSLCVGEICELEVGCLGSCLVGGLRQAGRGVRFRFSALIPAGVF